MIDQIKILQNNYYNKIKFYGYSLVVKETTIPEKLILKYRFYFESHDEKYELTVVTFNGNELYLDKLSEIKMDKVDNFLLPMDSNAKSIQFYKYLGSNIHLTYAPYLEANRIYEHEDKNEVKKYILNNKFNSKFIICEGFGVSIENETDIDEKVLKESLIDEKLDETANYGTVYINDLVFDRLSKKYMKIHIDSEEIIEDESYTSCTEVIEMEKLLEL